VWCKLLLAGSMLLAQAETPSESLKNEVDKLVLQLNDPQLGKREEAEKRILELGPAALDLLPATARQAEVKLRLERIRLALGRAQAEALAHASTVTLKAEKMPLLEVLAAIQEQTGNKIVDARDQFGQEAAAVSLTVDFDKTPFWEAFDKVLDQAGLTVYPYIGENALAVVGRGEASTDRVDQTAYVGAFRFDPMELLARRDLRTGEGQTLQLRVETAWEPRLAPIAIRQSMSDVTAVDERGETLSLSAPEAEVEIPINAGSSAAEMSLNFALPPRNVARIASLKGKLTTLLPTGVETFTFKDLGANRSEERRQANITVVLEQVRKNNELWEVRVRLHFDKAANALESHRGWVFNNPAYLLDPQGKQVAYATLETTRQTDNEVGFAYFFVAEQGLKDYQFVYKSPTVIMDRTIEYEIKDLELP
jgi:hypothetical protein